MRTLLPTAVFGIALLLGACGAEPGAAEVPEHPAGPTIVLAVPDGHSVRDIAEVLDARLQAAGLGRAAADGEEPAHVRCSLVQAVTDRDAERVAERLCGRGTLEFRIVAPEVLQRAEAEKREELGAFYRTPPGHLWLPRAAGGEDLMLELPEEEAELRLAAAEEAGDDAIVLEQLGEALAAIQATEVFTHRDIVDARAQAQGPETVLFFAMEDGRRDAFRGFTERNARRQLAIVIDGVIQTAPIIVSPLPGEGVISFRGAQGSAPHGVAILAAIVSGDLTLPVKLELVRIEPAAGPLESPAEEPR